MAYREISREEYESMLTFVKTKGGNGFCGNCHSFIELSLEHTGVTFPASGEELFWVRSRCPQAPGGFWSRLAQPHTDHIEGQVRLPQSK